MNWYLTVLSGGVVFGLRFLFEWRRTARRQRRAEQAHRERVVRDVERQLFNLSSRAFDAMLREARQAGMPRQSPPEL